MRTEDHGGIRVLYLDEVGPLVSTTQDGLDAIGDTWSVEATMVAIPVARLDPAFFDLSTLKAGDITQKMVQYSIRLAIVGDISAFEAASGALRDYVWESNRGRHVWFVPDEASLADRLNVS